MLYEVITSAWIERPPQTATEQRRRIGHGALHFVIDHAVIGQRRLGVVGFGELDPMTFLAEVPFLEEGKKGRIQIDVEQIEKIFTVLAGKRVA